MANSVSYIPLRIAFFVLIYFYLCCIALRCLFGFHIPVKVEGVCWCMFLCDLVCKYMLIIRYYMRQRRVLFHIQVRRSQLLTQWYMYKYFIFLYLACLILVLGIFIQRILLTTKTLTTKTLLENEI